MIAIFNMLNFINALPASKSGIILGKPLVAIDGRVAVSHNFTDEDIVDLVAKGATMYEELPSDFVVQE